MDARIQPARGRGRLLGWDELLLVVRDNTGTTGREIARRLHDRSQQEEVQHGDQRFSITLSIGIAWGGGVGFEDLLQRDLALYMAKKCGWNSWIHRSDVPEDAVAC